MVCQYYFVQSPDVQETHKVYKEISHQNSVSNSLYAFYHELVLKIFCCIWMVGRCAFVRRCTHIHLDEHHNTISVLE